MKIDINKSKPSHIYPEVVTSKNPRVTTFGNVFAPHMFTMNYREGEWQNASVEPYKHISMPPGSKGIQYAQSIFEGAKAFKHDDNELYTFRFEKNAQRMNTTAKFLGMPTIPIELQQEALRALLDVSRDFYPTNAGSSMYIRPFMYSDDPSLGVGQGNNFSYTIILSPSGPYFGGELKPIKILVAGNSFGRVPKGGMGQAKAAGNYQGYVPHMRVCNKFGTDQPLYGPNIIDETGAANHFHITNGYFVRQKFNENILKSITAESLSDIVHKVGLENSPININITDFLYKLGAKHSDERILEAGAMGTAAVIAPASEYKRILGIHKFEDLDSKPPESFQVETYKPAYSVGPYTKKLYELYTGIQQGLIEDELGWLEKVERRF